MVRDTDLPSQDAVRTVAAAHSSVPVRLALVTEPGFMPPICRGIQEAKGDVVAFLDDDAEAEPGWTSGLLRAYSSPAVGGAGGRCINMDRDREIPVPETSRVGYLSAWGKLVGNHFLRPAFHSPLDVDYLMGGCMSFRTSVARELEFDWALNRNVATGYEVDLGLQVRRSGHRIIFDPAVAIRHFGGPRAIAGNRDPLDEVAAEATAYNLTRIVLARAPGSKRAAFILRQFTLGERRAPGLLPWIASPLSRRLGFLTALGKAATRGRFQAIRDHLRRAR